MKMEFSAGGFLFKRKGTDIEIALILDAYGSWTFPKGHIEKGEKPEETAVREIAEETGLTKLEIKERLAKTDYWFKLDKKLIHKFVYVFLVENYQNEDFKIQTKEIKDAMWFSPQKAVELLGYKKDSLPLLKKALESLGVNCDFPKETLK